MKLDLRDFIVGANDRQLRKKEQDAVRIDTAIKAALEELADEEQDREWNIHELLDSVALHSEGRAMRHCVYSYTDRCRRGETTIWSLRLRVNGEEKRMVTIEVDAHRRSIVQARAKCNLRPGGRSLEIMQQWATHAGLHFDLT